MKKTPEEVARAAVKRLDHLVRVQGHGSIRRAERAAGRSKGWWRRVVRTGDLQLSDFFDICLEFKIAPHRLFESTPADDEPYTLHGDPPPIVEAALERLDPDLRESVRRRLERARRPNSELP